MARLHQGERARNQNRLIALLHSHFFGLRESEIAESLDWQRRTANNYLRDLQANGRAYKDGRDWFPEE